MVIDTAHHTLDEVMALIQLHGKDALAFRCQRCGRIHYLSAEAWKKCRHTFLSYNPDASNSSIICLQPEDTYYGSTQLILPGIRLAHPSINVHKLVFYPESQAVQLLAHYTKLAYRLYTSSMALTVTLFDYQVPLSLVLTREQYRQLVYRLMLENRSYQQYVCELKQCTAAMVQFVCRHPDLFIPYTPEKVIIDTVSTPKEGFIVRTEAWALDVNRLQSAAEAMLPTGASFFFRHVCTIPDARTTIHGWTVRSPRSCGCIGQSAKFALVLDPPPAESLDTTDPVTGYLVDLLVRLRESTVPAAQALSSYIATVSREVNSCACD